MQYLGHLGTDSKSSEDIEGIDEVILTSYIVSRMIGTRIHFFIIK